MRFKVGQRVRINTFDNVRREIQKRYYSGIEEDVILNFFWQHGNKAAIVDEITEDNYISLCVEGVKGKRLKVPERHFLYALKNYISIELDENLFEL